MYNVFDILSLLYIYIERERETERQREREREGAVWCGFHIIKLQTALHRVQMQCCAMRCGYAILRAILVWFLQFVRFGEHPYFYPSIIQLINKQ